MHTLVFLGVPTLPIHHFLLGSEETVDGFRRDHVNILLFLQEIKVLLDDFLCLFVVLVVLVRVLKIIKCFFEVYLSDDSYDREDLSDCDESHDEERKNQRHFLRIHTPNETQHHEANKQHDL